MNTNQLTRRRVLTMTGGAAATGLAGCLGDDTDPTDDHAEELAGVDAERDAYVAIYHWGFAAFDENGDELDVIEVEPNTELTLHVVNDHAYDAFEELPDAVATELEDFDALARTKEKVKAGELPEPDGATVEEVYNEAHGDDDDHGHDDHDDDHDDGHDDHDDDHDDGHDDHDDHDDGHGHDDDHDDHDHDDAQLDHGFAIPDLDVQMEVPWDEEEPVEATAVVEEPGTYEASCIVGCGYYHAHQQEPLIEATDA